MEYQTKWQTGKVSVTKSIPSRALVQWAFCACLLLFIIVCMLGCTAPKFELTPAPYAIRATQPNSAEARSAGVQIVLAAGAWDGYPRNLGAKIMPLEITIRNNSGHVLAVRYKDFVLESPNGRRYIDIPYVAPYSYYSYPGLGFWPGFLWGPPDWVHFSNYSGYMRRIYLPTQSMLRKELPEGAVTNGSSSTGFLYFQKLAAGKKQHEPITFNATLLDAQTKRELGSVSIPFVERQG